MPGSLLEPTSNNIKNSQRSAALTSPPSSSSPSSSPSPVSPLFSLINNNRHSHPHHHRHHLTSSARSDRSDGSAYSSEGGGSTTSKKVSFNKAVRVKKYSQPPTQSGDLSESKFWFKVHKANSDHLNTNNHHHHHHSYNQQNQHHHQPLNNQTVNVNNNSENNINNSQQEPRTRHQLSIDNNLIDSIKLVDDNTFDNNSSQLSEYIIPIENNNGSSSIKDSDEPRPLSTIIESDLKLSSSSLLVNPKPASKTPMAPAATRKEGTKIIDYSDNQGIIERNSENKSTKGSIIDDHSTSFNKNTNTLNKNHHVINYEPFRSASTLGLDVDSSLRPRSPSPMTRNGRHSSVDSCHRTTSSQLNTTNNNNNNSIRPGSAVSEEIIETKTIEKKNPILSGVKVMFGVKAKRAPTFPTMPNRSKSVDRTTTTTVKPILSKPSATIARPTLSRFSNTSTLKAREPQISNVKSRLFDTSPSKSSLIQARNPPLTSSLKKTTQTAATKNTSFTSNSSARLASKSNAKVTNNENTKSSVVLKSNDEPESAIELTREKAADQSTIGLIPVATWSSGPVLIANQADKQTTSSYIPGEGKLMASFEEGTKTWKSKTRRVYEEPIKIPRDKSNSLERLESSPERAAITSPTDSIKRSIESKSPERESPSRTHSPTRHHERSIEDEHNGRSISPRPNSRHDPLDRSSRQRSPSPIARKSPTRQDDSIDGQLHKTTRTRFSPSPETFYRSLSYDDNSNGESKLPTIEALDDVFLRKDIHPNGHEPNGQNDSIIDYVPKMEDKACQCNLKKSSKSRLSDESGLGYRVIKPATDGSVSTFSNVPDISDAETELDPPMDQPKINGRQIRSSRSPSPIERRTVSPQNINSEVIYSQIDRSKKRPNMVSSPNHFSHSNYPSDILDQPGEYPDDYLYESNAIKSARSSVSPAREEIKESRNRDRSNDSYRKSPSPSPSRRYMFEMERNNRSEIPSSSSPRPKTVSVTSKTYGFNMRTALDAPEVNLPVRPPSSKPIRMIEPADSYYSHNDEMLSRSENRFENNVRSRNQIREETMSNISSDELVQSMPRRGDMSDPDDFTAPKSIIREIDHRKGEINYENVTPGSRNRSTGVRQPYDDRVSNGGGTNNMWFRSLDDDYRKGMSERDGNAYNHEIDNVTDYCTMSRRGRNRSASRDIDYSPSSMGHAYTLDRRHLERAKTRSKRQGPSYSTAGSHLGISSPMSMSMNGQSPATANSINMRKYNSTRDLTNYSSDFGDMGSTRGGLAAAYKARQRRASSLSRYGQSPSGYLPLSSSPHSHRTSHSVLSSPAYPLHGSHSQLHRLHLSGSENGYPHHHHHHHHHSHSLYHHPIRSSASHIGTGGGSHYGHSSSESEAGIGSHQRAISGSRSRLHQNDPVVLYIPAISHHHRPVDEDDRNSALGIARTQSILSSSKRSVKNNSNKKREPSKERDANFNEITTKVNGYLDGSNRIKSQSGLDGDDEIIELRDEDENNMSTKMNGKKNVKRSVSIPKDAKLPWLQKLKMKVKS